MQLPMPNRRGPFQRGPWASLVLLCGLLAVLVNPCASSKPREELSRADQLCWERLVDAVRNLSDIGTFDPVEKRDIRIHDENARPAIISSSRLPAVARRSETYEIVNQNASEESAIDCCRRTCTLEELIRFGVTGQ